MKDGRPTSRPTDVASSAAPRLLSTETASVFQGDNLLVSCVWMKLLLYEIAHPRVT